MTFMALSYQHNSTRDLASRPRSGPRIAGVVFKEHSFTLSYVFLIIPVSEFPLSLFRLPFSTQPSDTGRRRSLSSGLAYLYLIPSPGFGPRETLCHVILDYSFSPSPLACHHHFKPLVTDPSSSLPLPLTPSPSTRDREHLSDAGSSPNPHQRCVDSPPVLQWAARKTKELHVECAQCVAPIFTGMRVPHAQSRGTISRRPGSQS